MCWVVLCVLCNKFSSASVVSMGTYQSVALLYYQVGNCMAGTVETTYQPYIESRRRIVIAMF